MPAAVGAAALETAFQQVLINVVVAVAVNQLTKALAKKPVRRVQKVDVAYQGGLEPRRKLYGFFRAAGLDVIPAVTTAPARARIRACAACSWD